MAFQNIMRISRCAIYHYDSRIFTLSKDESYEACP